VVIFHLKNHFRDLTTSADGQELREHICKLSKARFVLKHVFCTFPQPAQALCGISLGSLEVRRKH